MHDAASRKGLKDFRFWLFSDQLLYGEAIPLNPSKFVLNRQIPLSQCFVSSCESMMTLQQQQQQQQSTADIEEQLSTASFIVESPAKSFIVRTK